MEMHILDIFSKESKDGIWLHIDKLRFHMFLLNMTVDWKHMLCKYKSSWGNDQTTSHDQSDQKSASAATLLIASTANLSTFQQFSVNDGYQKERMQWMPPPMGQETFIPIWKKRYQQ